LPDLALLQQQQPTREDIGTAVLSQTSAVDVAAAPSPSIQLPVAAAAELEPGSESLLLCPGPPEHGSASFQSVIIRLVRLYEI
jgi:hypothetical protein